MVMSIEKPCLMLRMHSCVTLNILIRILYGF